MNKISCCYKCEPPKRHAGCHAVCEEYQKQKREWDEMRERHQKEKNKHYDLTSYDVARHERVRKATKKK